MYVNCPLGQPRECRANKEEVRGEEVNCAFQEMPREGKGKREIVPGAATGLRRQCSRERRPVMLEGETGDLRKRER